VPAVACLRVALDEDRTGLDPETLARLVSKFSSAYLETRWIWPRQFAPLTSFSFLLTDPRADELDPAELSRLSDELQAKLFGERDGGEVSLLLFEGPIEAITAFAALDSATAARCLIDPSLLPPGGRLTRIRSDDWVPIETEAARVPVRVASAPEARVETFQGIYFLAKQTFVADVISVTRAGHSTYLSITDGPAHEPDDHVEFDADCIATGLRVMGDLHSGGLLYLPVSYSNMLRPSHRAAYEQLLATLPEDCSRRLGAVVYDVPRDPGFSGMSQLSRTLGRYFGKIVLRVTDPEFAIENLPPRIVSGVAFSLPSGDPRLRLAVLRRFGARRRSFQQKQVWASITNVRSRAELYACATLNVPFVSGPSVGRPQPTPIAGRMRPITELGAPR
jgi:hypothetical protein